MKIFLNGYEQMNYIIGERVNEVSGKEYIINKYYDINNINVHICSMYLFDNDIILISIIEESSTYIKIVKINESQSITSQVESRIPSIYLDNLDDLYGSYLYKGLKDLDLILLPEKYTNRKLIAIDYFGFPGANKLDIKNLEFTFKYYNNNNPHYIIL